MGGWVGVENEVNANSAPNWVGVEVGAELGNTFVTRVILSFLKDFQRMIKCNIEMFIQNARGPPNENPKYNKGH